MKVKQLYTKCLAEATYYISSDDEAAIIDPLRETKPYLELLATDKAKLKYVFLTHFHADFVSGHVDLAKATGATIIYGPSAKADFDFYEGKDGELFSIGTISLQLIHTPGHTLESSSYLLFDPSGKEHCLFSGDTLFIGDVGRPDLAITSSISKEDLASKLYDSLHKKILSLPDDIIIYPNHGKGSACGKNMSSQTFDTLGHQKEVNYALQLDLTKDDFVQQVLDGLHTPPPYFPKNALLNKQINKDVNLVITNGLFPMSASEVQRIIASDNVLVLDVRTAGDFCEKHIPNSLFIGLEGDFAPWVGGLIQDIEQSIILITPEGKEEEAITRLSRIGYDNVIGYLEDGITAWENANYAVTSVASITTDMVPSFSENIFIDVRRNGEFNDNHVKDAIHISLQDIYTNMSALDMQTSYFVYCAGGYRSVIAAAILKRHGYHHLINIKGGFAALLQSTVSLEKCRKNCALCACSG